MEHDMMLARAAWALCPYLDNSLSITRVAQHIWRTEWSRCRDAIVDGLEEMTKIDGELRTVDEVVQREGHVKIDGTDCYWWDNNAESSWQEDEPHWWSNEA